MIEVKKVIKTARQVVIEAGCVEVTFFLNQSGRLQEISRLNRQAQRLGRESLYISPADYRQALRRAAAILCEEKRKAPIS